MNKVETSELNARIVNTLIYYKIYYLEEINNISRHHFKLSKNIGKKSYQELSDYLEKLKIEWR